MRRWFFSIFVLVITLTSIPLQAEASSDPPELQARAAVLMDMETGRVLYSKNEHDRLPPASTTKIMTALVALEHGDLGRVIVAPPSVTGVEGTSAYLVPGEQHTLEEMLYALLLNSANDVASAIAWGVSGDEAGFVALMNEKARELGLRDTHFVNSHGLPAEGHYSSAYDLAQIARAAMGNETFRRIVRTYTRPWKGDQWETVLVNRNRLLKEYEGTTGIKTGYTREAGWCLVASAERKGVSLIAVVLNSTGNGVWEDAKALLDYGFNNYQKVIVIEQGAPVLKMKSGSRLVRVVAGQTAGLLKMSGDPSLPEGEIILTKQSSRFGRGEQVGEIRYFLKGEQVAAVPLIAADSTGWFLGWKDLWLILTTAVFVIVVARRLRWLARRRPYRLKYVGRGK